MFKTLLIKFLVRLNFVTLINYFYVFLSYRCDSVRDSERVLLRRIPEVVNNYFLYNFVYFVLAKSIDCRIPMATETLLCFAFLDASVVDNIKDIKIWRRQSEGDASRISTGMINTILPQPFKNRRTCEDRKISSALSHRKTWQRN